MATSNLGKPNLVVDEEVPIRRLELDPVLEMTLVPMLELLVNALA